MFYIHEKMAVMDIEKYLSRFFYLIKLVTKKGNYEIQNKLF